MPSSLNAVAGSGKQMEAEESASFSVKALIQRFDKEGIRGTTPSFQRAPLVPEQRTVEHTFDEAFGSFY